MILIIFCFFFFNYTATTKIYPLSLHDALPISRRRWPDRDRDLRRTRRCRGRLAAGYIPRRDRKSTRLNSSHLVISYAVFCLKKKNNQNNLVPLSSRYLLLEDSHRVDINTSIHS